MSTIEGAEAHAGLRDRISDLRNKLDAKDAEIARLTARLADAIELLDFIKGQWGSDYLWSKWHINEDITKIKAAQE